MKSSDVRNMTAEELLQKEKELRKELFNLRFQQATGEIQNPKRISAVRKDIARILTITTEKEKQKTV
ncbi:MAG: 50S ribosomal protein L29 [Nitrospirae bacterium]|nr:50S ribosomal protein L29 [Nitrospirota bacterium]